MNIKDLAKKIALTALASVYGNSNNVVANNTNEHLDVLGDNNRKIFANKPNLILKKPVMDYNRFVDNPDSHRSHRSHSSHRSHYSSSGSSRSYTPSKKKSSSSSSSRSSTSNSFYSPAPKTYTPPKVTTVTNELGDRTLRFTSKGDDVRELKKILAEKGFPCMSSTEPKNVFGTVCLESVKKFQKSVGLLDDGIVDQITLFYLKRKNQTNITKPSYPTTNSNTSVKRNNTYRQNTTTQSSVVSKIPDTEEGNIYQIIKATSLRRSGNSKASVIERVGIGQNVVILNSISTTYWWKVKVSKSGEIGWIKKLNLKKIKTKAVSNTSSSYSSIKTVNTDSDGRIKINYTLKQKAHVRLQIYDMKREEVYNSLTPNRPAKNYIKSIDLNDLPNGSYKLIISASGKKIEEYKIIKR